jgi:mono/diheme cytochrome c family protein
MKKRNLLIRVLIAGGALVTGAQLSRISAAKDLASDMVVTGPELYKTYCASCHGLDGKGAGPVAAALKNRLPDLTTINSRNGGTFPEFRIGHIIDGDVNVVGHGTRDMPVWGDLLPQHRDDTLLKLREHNLTEYVRSLQK